MVAKQSALLLVLLKQQALGKKTPTTNGIANSHS
jgi:hypothetical protein